MGLLLLYNNLDIGGLHHILNLTESLTILDTFGKSVEFDLSLIEEATLVDSVIQGPNLNRVDTVIGVDSLDYVYEKFLNDTVTITDNLSREALYKLNIDNSVNIRYIINTDVIRKYTWNGFIWKDVDEHAKKIFGRKTRKTGFSN